MNIYISRTDKYKISKKTRNILVWGSVFFFFLNRVISPQFRFVDISALSKIPRASFTWKQLIPISAGIVRFLDRSKNGPTSWTWDFGDGTTSSVQDPFHIYKSSGIYRVKLIVTNQYGSSKMTRSVFVIKARGYYVSSSDRFIDWDVAGVWANGIKGIPNRDVIFCNVKVSIPGSSLVAYGDGAHDDTAALQAAIDLCPVGQVVYLPAGTYLVSNSLTISKGITLRGDVDADNNPLAKIIQTMTLSSNSSTILVTGTSAYPYSDVVDATGGYQKGSTSITVSSTSKFKVGDIVTLDELNNPALVTNYGRVGDNGTLNQCTFAGRIEGGTRAVGDTVLIKAIAGNTITLNRPLYWDFQGSLNPQLYLHAKVPLYYAGIENIQLTAGSDVTEGTGIILQHCAYCWVKNCAIESFPSRGIWIRYGAYGCEIRRNFIYNKPTDLNFTSNRRYAIYLMGSSDNLIEDNIVYYAITCVVLGTGNSGNVIAYNYFDTTRYGDGAWKTPDVSIHAPHNTMNLFEGNVAGMVEYDVYFGSSSHTMTFRNWFHTKNPDWYVNQPRVAITCDGWNRYCSFIGNVLGYPGIIEAESPWPVYYEQLPFSGTYQKVHMWKVGFWNGAEGTVEAHGDLMTVATTIRHANYDFVRNQIDWDESLADYKLPSSLYLKAKPEWFGSLPWPAIGPDVSPVNGKIPAQWRFENKKYFANI